MLPQLRALIRRSTHRQNHQLLHASGHRTLLNLGTGLLLALATGTASAQATPVGLWKTIDDITKTERSLVRITEVGGALSGKVERIFDASKASARCEACTDERKGQPVQGLPIIRNARPDAERELWEGGDILDPENGKVYRLRLKPLEGGKKLEVRGYIGPFFRSQQWIRVE